MYTFNSRVRYSEVDSDARLTLDGIINYMQDCTNFQSEDLGVGLDFHKERQIADMKRCSVTEIFLLQRRTAAGLLLQIHSGCLWI